MAGVCHSNGRLWCRTTKRFLMYHTISICISLGFLWIFSISLVQSHLEKQNKVVFTIMVLICFLFFGLSTELIFRWSQWLPFLLLQRWSELFISSLASTGSGCGNFVNKVSSVKLYSLRVKVFCNSLYNYIIQH